MFNFISGTIFGIIVGTIGITNVARVFDAPIQGIQKFALDSAASSDPPPHMIKPQKGTPAPID